MDKYIFWINNPKILYENDKYLEFVPKSNMNRAEQLNAITRFLIYFIVLALILQKPTLWIQIPIIIIIFIVFIYSIFKVDKEGLKNELYRLKGIDVNAMGDEDYNLTPEERKKNNEEKTDRFVIESGYYDSDNRLMVGKYLSSHQPTTQKLKFSLDDFTEYEKSVCRKPSMDNPFMNPLLKDITLNPNDPEPVACNADDEQIKEKIVDCYNEDLYRDVGDLYERYNSQRQFYTVPHMYPNDQQSFAEWCYKDDNICKVDQSKCLKYEDLRYKRLTT